MKFYRGSAGEAVGYAFSDERLPADRRAEDYYLAEGGDVVERLTVGADKTVRRDTLDREQYARWVEGNDPLSDRTKGTPRCEADRALRFVEVTVNGPKTWTVAAELHPDVAEAYATAQDRATESLARSFASKCKTRTGAGGTAQMSLSEVEVVAIRHYTSRAGDPHRHIHLQLNARVLSADGLWRSVDSMAFRLMIAEINGLGHLSVLADPMFRQALASHGYTLDRDGEIVQLAAAVPVLSKRHAQIDRNLATLEREWREQNPGEEPSRQLRREWDREAWKQDRPGKGRQHDPAVLSSRWLGELEAAGIDPGVERARPGQLPVGVPPGMVDRDTVVTAALGRLGAQRSRWNEHDLTGAICIELAEAGLVAEGAALGELVEDCTARGLDVCESMTGPGRVASHVRHLTSPEVIECWDDLQSRFASRSHPGNDAADADIARAMVPDRDSNSYRSGTIPDLDDGQIRAVRAVAGTGQLVNIEGAAGTGKTTMLAVATRAIEQSGGRVVLVAPSAKAAKVAEWETGAPGNTLAKLIHEHGYRWDHAGRMTRLAPGDIDPDHWENYVGPRVDWQLDPSVTVIVDEAGMVDQDTGRALLTIADETGARIVNVGDRSQLPAVGRGGYLQAAASWVEPVVMADIHRFRTLDEHGRSIRDDAYAELSCQMRTGDDPGDVFDQLVARGQVQVHDEPAEARAEIADDWMTHARAGDSATIVAATNREAAEINHTVRHRRVIAGYVDDTAVVFGRDGNPIGIGDRITTRRNDRDLGVLNREEWTITAIGQDGSATARGGLQDRTVTLNADYIGESTHLAYAVTDYGSQGTTVDRGIVRLAEETTAAGLYVAMTRGRYDNTVHIVADNLDQARVQWIDAAGRDRADRGLAAELEAVQRDVAQAPTPPVQRALGFDTSRPEPAALPVRSVGEQVDDALEQARADYMVAEHRLDRALASAAPEVERLTQIAQILNEVDRAHAETGDADRDVQVATRQAETARQDRADLDATRTRATYKPALAEAKHDGDQQRVAKLERYRAMSRPARQREESRLRAVAIDAQRRLTPALELRTVAEGDLAHAASQLEGVDVPRDLLRRSERDPAGIDRLAHGAGIDGLRQEVRDLRARFDEAAVAQLVLKTGEDHIVVVPYDPDDPIRAVARSDWDRLGRGEQLNLASSNRAILEVTREQVEGGGVVPFDRGVDGLIVVRQEGVSLDVGI